ncbi:uncharacterized protein LOC120345327 isoform X1 [Styela clava]
MATRMYVCESVEHPSSLLMGLNEQRLQGQLCDITVRVQGHLFKAHTNVLASAMGYFRDLFLNPNKQVKKDVIEIPMIVNSVGFAKVLDFIYTSQLCLSQSSVMQVLCSACYLQIPYVVDKCQEFIVTHGHVSPQNTFPAIPDQRYLPNKDSDNQECELINTPPSPGNQSGTNSNRGEDVTGVGSPIVNDEPHDLSPEGKSDNLLIKQENAENSSGNGEQANSDSNPATRALIEFSNQSRLNHILGEGNPHRNGALKMLLQNGEGQGPDGDLIDHESLAEYFARNGHPAGENPYGSIILGRSSPSTSVEQHLYSMTKNISSNSPSKETMTSSPTSSVSQYLLAMKKEKPKKEYRCEYCNKLFGRQQHLKRHILTHTGERPYPCNLCEKRFRRSEHLKHHLVKHQQEANIAGNGTTNQFVDFNSTSSATSTGRKRPRKAAPSDAYSMSKMMLVSYNQQQQANESNSVQDNKVAERDLIGSNPILLNKLNSGSALDSISERLAFAASQRGENEQDNSYSNAAGSPVALNLSSKDMTQTVTKVQEVFNEPRESPSHNAAIDSSPSENQQLEHGNSPQNGLDMSVTSSNTGNGEGNTEELNNSVDDEGMTNSEDSKQSSSPADAQNAPNAMSIENFTSEVVTPELKRLFAAMDG